MADTEYDEGEGSVDMNIKDSGESIVSISLSKRSENGFISAGVAHLKGSKILLFDFSESTAQLCGLESLLIRLAPTRCYFPSSNSLLKVGPSIEKNLQSLLQVINVDFCAPVQDALQLNKKMENIEQDLRLLTGQDSSSLTPYMELKEALKALVYLMTEESLLGRDVDDGDNKGGNFTLSIGKMDQYMKLDAAAINALHIFPSLIPGVNSSNMGNNNASNSSVHGILDKCRTKKLGSRLLAQWLRQPLRDMNEINRRHGFVSLFVDNPTCRNGVRDALGHTPDVESITRRFLSKKAGLVDLYKLYLFVVNTIPKLIEMLSSLESEENYIKELVDEMNKMKSRLEDYKELVERVLDFKYAPREFRVLPSCDETSELKSLAEEIQTIDSKVQEIRDDLENGDLRDMAPRFEHDEKALKTYGYHFRISKRYDTQLMKVADKDTHYLAVVNQGIRWTTPELTELWNEHQSLLQQYHTAQTAIVKDTCDMAMIYLPLMEAASSICAEIDVLCSFAHVAATSPAGSFIRPKMVERSKQKKASSSENVEEEDSDVEIFISQGRHPCLELQDLESHQDFIPNDYKFGRKNDRFQIITGPNMGGKSTYIRTLGVLCVMAQVGSFIPCEEAKLPILDAVLARVGASDAQLRGVSTFMAEMLEASAILQTATSKSLVIIDELGRGTSTYDGFGLAWGISAKLAKDIGCIGMFATHFHEMTSMANEIPCVSNKHVTAIESNGSVTMLYSVKDGPCLNSFGIAIARLAKFPEDVLQVAQEKASQLETFAKSENNELNESDSKRRKDDEEEESAKENAGNQVINSEDGLLFLQSFVDKGNNKSTNDIVSKTKALLSEYQLQAAN